MESIPLPPGYRRGRDVTAVTYLAHPVAVSDRRTVIVTHVDGYTFLNELHSDMSVPAHDKGQSPPRIFAPQTAPTIDVDQLFQNRLSEERAVPPHASRMVGAKRFFLAHRRSVMGSLVVCCVLLVAGLMLMPNQGEKTSGGTPAINVEATSSDPDPTPRVESEASGEQQSATPPSQLTTNPGLQAQTYIGEVLSGAKGDLQAESLKAMISWQASDVAAVKAVSSVGDVILVDVCAVKNKQSVTCGEVSVEVSGTGSAIRKIIQPATESAAG